MKSTATKDSSVLMRQFLGAATIVVMLVGQTVLAQQPGSTAAPNATVTTIVLSISPHQVVGHSLQETATIILRDSANNLITDYDLAANPIWLSSSSGRLINDTLSDTALFSNGEINFLPSQCMYLGSTGTVPIVASNGLVNSVPVLVSFSGYDILKVTDFKGDSIVEVYQGLPTAVKVTVNNRGGLTAVINPSVRSYFQAGGGSVQVFFTGHKDGFVDTVTMIDTAFVSVIVDTLIVQLDARYRIGTSEFLTADTVRLPVYVRTPATVAFAAGSITPDSVYAGENFPMGFQIQTTGFSGPIDSTRVELELAPNTVDPSVARMYLGSPTYASFSGGVITYAGLGAKVVPLNGFAPGWYLVRADYHLFSGGSEFILNSVHPDSLYVIPRSGPEYVPGSFDPDTVAAGAEVSFQFGLLFADGANLEVESGSGTFTIIGTGFEATVNLMIPGDMIISGDNVISTENVFIPANQLGNTLTVSAELRYRRFGSPTYLTFSTTFNDQAVQVQQFPLVQIVSLDCVAPNGNKVNTNQPFQMHARIANVSESPAEALVFRLTSDGTSIDSLFQPVTQIPPLDTYDLYFDLVASATANPAEIFSVNFVSGNAGRLPPVDNIALVNIQTPATLVLLYDTVGARDGFVTYGEPFTIVVTLTNLGQASTSPGLYRLATDGFNLLDSLSDTTGEISDQMPRSFPMHAPSADTSIPITLQITQRPSDLNTMQPAAFYRRPGELSDTSFQVTITVASPSARLVVQKEQTADRPLAGHRESSLFFLRFHNTSGSLANVMQLDSVVLHFADRDGRPTEVGRLIEVTHSGFYDDTLKVAEASSSADRLTLRFGNFQIGSVDRMIDFRATVIERVDNSMSIYLDSASIFSKFTTGPAKGFRVPISPPVPGAPILNLTIATGGSTLASSFMVENNPWHQETSPARFAYVLEENSPLEFRIFTLTGELVHSVIVADNSPLGLTGTHVIEWDGRNDRGKVVLDGVYIVQLANTRTGERARLKLAVLK